jgi:hypothetical protein
LLPPLAALIALAISFGYKTKRGAATMKRIDEVFTEAQALDEAVLLLTRKLRRLHPGAHDGLMAALSVEAREALRVSEMRAEVLRDTGLRRFASLPTLDDE